MCPLMKKALAEAVGSCVLVLAILSSKGSAIFVPVSLLGLVYVCGSISGSHFNPAISFASAFRFATTLSVADVLVYVAAQFAGAHVALNIYDHFVK